MTSRVTPGLFGLMEGQWVCQARGSHHNPLHHNAIRAAKNNNCTPAPPPVQRILQERGLVQAPEAESAGASPPRETASILWKELEKAGNPASAERGERGRDGQVRTVRTVGTVGTVGMVRTVRTVGTVRLAIWWCHEPRPECRPSQPIDLLSTPDPGDLAVLTTVLTS